MRIEVRKHENVVISYAYDIPDEEVTPELLDQLRKGDDSKLQKLPYERYDELLEYDDPDHSKTFRIDVGNQEGYYLAGGQCA